jgi:hypothetical protein
VVGVADASLVYRVDDNEFFSLSLGWGLVLVVVAGVSLAAWGIATVSISPRQQRVLSAAAVTIALLGSVVLVVALGRLDDPNDGDTASVAPDFSTSSTTTEAPPTTTEAPPTTTSPVVPATDCESLGINRVARKEGACTDGELKLRVVERTTPLQLDEISIRNVSYELVREIPSTLGEAERPAGRFVKVTFTVRNKTTSPIALEMERFGLQANGASYNTDFDAMNVPGDSCVWESEELGPDLARTCWIAFDLSARNARKVKDDGMLVVVQPSEDDIENPTSRVGFIRLYD